MTVELDTLQAALEAALGGRAHAASASAAS
jgi:hypothetical protein